MDDPQVIREQMEGTRVSLQEKVELLEQQVVGTVQDATAAVSDTVTTVKMAVEDTVESVKDSVEETIDSVKETVSDTVSSVLDGIDVRHHVEERPWQMMLGAVAAGFVAGRLLDSFSDSQPSHYVPGARPTTGPLAAASNGAASGVASALSGVGEMFGPELRKLKELALGATGAVVRDMVTMNVPPPVRSQLAEVIDDFTAKLGGKPIHGRLLDTGSQTSG